jgi:hypothetical protein
MPDDHAVQLLRVTAEARGSSEAWRAVFVTHVRFSEVWLLRRRPVALDEFWNSLGGPSAAPGQPYPATGRGDCGLDSGSDPPVPGFGRVHIR